MQQSRQLRIILITTFIIVAALLITIIFLTQNIMNNLKNSPKEIRNKVAILTSDEVADQSWGSLAYKGKINIEEQFSIKAHLDSKLDTEEKMQNTVKRDIEKGYNILIGHGGEFSGVFTKLAPAYPKVRFITVHGTAQYPNQTVYIYDQGDVEYFAALASSLKTKSNKVGLIDSSDSRAKNPEFEKGLNHYKPNIQFYYKVVNSRDDGKKAVSLLKELKNQGVDVVYSKGNGYNREVIEYAKHHGIYVVGYLDDQSYMGKQTVLTSVVNNIPQIYVAIMKDFYSQKGIPSGEVILKEKDGVYGLAPFGPMFSEAEKRYINKELKKYKQGKLSF
ncbi:BMP family ABC transporter substrate-binding protein [Metabacillus sp. RGM 3146]|uniref:BMP family ABC transporter substrate-binding protein n=1 Tax=Metabacillus sp. RGM 3146 TaxID=3401092 RepID=UPI003B99F166